VHSATSTVPRRQGRTAAIRRAIAITTCCMWWIESRRSRRRAAHAATRARAGMVVAKSPDIARVAATSPTWAHRPIATGRRPTSGAYRRCCAVRPAMPSKSSRTRRHTRLKRHQVVPTHQSGSKARRYAPVAQQRVNGLFGPIQQGLHDPPRHMGRRGDLVDREFHVGISCLALRKPSRTRGHTRPFRGALAR
jgi:hypothetical protein